ncbi:hypothetical protein VTJ04DRAFT_3872 [Mycothermus thermophilus]|uniref:uncharacterized protein n=1 Tax=Humicola insolens TaxID=85995 RepID=UPI0037421CAD
MSVASKNLYDLLGNDIEGDEPPAPPVKPVTKAQTSTVKRNSDGTAPSSRAPHQGGNRRGGAHVSGNEAAFRDRNAGRESNRDKPTDEAPRGARRGGFRGRGRRPDEGDRHPYKHAPRANSEKQASQAWGAVEGEAELKDEQAAAEIAQSEKAEGEASPVPETKEEEPEEKHMTYDQYLAQLAEKKLALEGELKVRKPNEGVKDEKWKDLKPLTKEEDELFPATHTKHKRERERKTKQFIEIDARYVEPERTRGGRGGRGGGRGDGPRGRGRGGARGDFRGGRGGARQDAAPLNPNDESAFPSLGSK